MVEDAGECEQLGKLKAKRGVAFDRNSCHAYCRRAGEQRVKGSRGSEVASRGTQVAIPDLLTFLYFLLLSERNG